MAQLQDHSLARRLNSLRSATRNLPPETLAHIFLLAITPVDIDSKDLRIYREEKYSDPRETYHPIRLGAVCLQWFHVAHSNPHLWSSLVLDMRSPRQVQRKVVILQTYLRNSKSVLFSLELNVKSRKVSLYGGSHPTFGFDAKDPEECALLEPLHSIIFTCPENSRRIRVLRISGLLSVWPRLSFDNFSNLEELRLGDGRICATGMAIENLHTPRLNRIVVTNLWFFFVPGLNVSHANNMTTIDLFQVLAMNCYKLLIAFPNLIEFRARGTPSPLFSLHPHVLPDRRNFTMSKLEVFEWTCSDYEWDSALLTHARFPALRVLSLGGGSSWENAENFMGFFRRLPPSLTELKISGVEKGAIDTSCNWENSWHLFDTIQKLSLRRCSYRDTSKILASLEAKECLPVLQEICLVEKPDSEAVEEIRCIDLRSSDPNIRTLGEPRVRLKLRNMLDSRWSDTKGERFRFSTVGRDLKWDWDDRVMVRSVVERGLELVMYEDGRLLEELLRDRDDVSEEIRSIIDKFYKNSDWASKKEEEADYTCVEYRRECIRKGLWP